MGNLRKQKHLLIYPRFQLRLVGLNALVMCAAFGFVAYQIHRAVDQLKNMGVQVSLRPEHPYFKFVEYHAENLYWAILIAFGISALVSALFSLHLSHRLAGPIVRLKSYFSSLAQPRSDAKAIEQLKFRENDFFKELPPIINSALKNLDANHSTKDSSRGEAA